MQRMLSMRDLKAQDLQGLPPADLTALASQMLEHIGQQARELDLKHKLLERKDREIAWRDAKLEKVTFELARLKRWKFGAKTEAMTAEQRALFQDTLAEDEASLRAQLAALQAGCPRPQGTQGAARQAPAARRCPSTSSAWSTATSPPTPPAPRRSAASPCSAWARTSARSSTSCRQSSSCIATSTASGPAAAASRLVQEPAEPDVVDGGIPASGWWPTR
jgi:transposase